MKKMTTLVVLALLCLYQSRAQSISPGTASSFYLAISDTTIIDHIGTNGVPVFNVAGVNSIFSNYTVYKMGKASNDTRFERSRRIWMVTANSLSLGADLKAAYPHYFPTYEATGARLLSPYVPNDSLIADQDAFLTFIKAYSGWGISRGDEKTLIGITDSYFDLTNPDLKAPKIAHILSNVPNGSSPDDLGHGTPVAGLAAGATDNQHLRAGIGFNCRLDISTNKTDPEMEALSQPPADPNAARVRVLNGSWVNSASATLDLASQFESQEIYNRIYENGVIACFGAGNGLKGNPLENPAYFCYPASLDHNISVTGVSHYALNNTATGGTTNTKPYVHDILIGFPDSSYMHNSRIDICAPALGLPTLGYKVGDTTVRLTGFWATSAATPLVSGTLGLMASANSCLSPYQLEYLLKKYSDSVIYSVPENALYTGTDRYHGMIGAGALHMGNAVTAAQAANCNDPATQTFYIQGVEFNHKCAPGTITGNSNPKLKPILVNGTPPYTCKWEPYLNGGVSDNNTTLSSYTTLEPEIISATNNKLAYYRLTVYDNSEVQKVASKVVRLQLKDSLKSDLSMRDSYMDMLNEPNAMGITDKREWQIWQSPDLWNRNALDGNREHINPEWTGQGDSSYMYIRVKSIGCISSYGGWADLYWTAASTTETWPNDWTTAQTLGSGGGYVPLGQLIGRLNIPQLAPGDSFITAHAWMPQQPESYLNQPNHVDVCGLARLTELISDGHYTIQKGPTFPEVPQTKTNVLNNNDIVTRNMILTNYIPGMGKPENDHHTLYAGSSEKAKAKFRFEMLTDRNIQLHFAGNLSEYLYVKLELGDLYDRWQSGGALGNVAQSIPESRAVLYDPATPLELDNILIEPGELFPINISFVYKDDLNTAFDVTGQQIHFRQFLKGKDGDELYGNVSFGIDIQKGANSIAQRGSNAATAAASALTACNYKVFPNPVSKTLSIAYSGTEKTTSAITVTDITGKVMISKRTVELAAGTVYTLNTAALAPGIYLVNIKDNKGAASTFKITKTD